MLRFFTSGKEMQRNKGTKPSRVVLEAWLKRKEPYLMGSAVVLSVYSRIWSKLSQRTLVSSLEMGTRVWTATCTALVIETLGHQKKWAKLAVWTHRQNIFLLVWSVYIQLILPCYFAITTIRVLEIWRISVIHCCFNSCPPQLLPDIDHG